MESVLEESGGLKIFLSALELVLPDGCHRSISVLTQEEKGKLSCTDSAPVVHHMMRQELTDIQKPRAFKQSKAGNSP